MVARPSDFLVSSIRLDEYDDDFFLAHAPALSLYHDRMFDFPVYILTCPLIQLVHSETHQTHYHLALLTERQEALLKQPRELAQAGFAKAEEE